MQIKVCSPAKTLSAMGQEEYRSEKWFDDIEDIKLYRLC